MEGGLIAHRYAKALLKVAQEQKEEERIYEDMRYLECVWKEHEDVRQYATSPILSKKKKKMLWAGIAVHCRKLTKKFLDLLVENHRDSLLERIIWHYGWLYRDAKHIAQVKMELAFSPKDSLKNSLKNSIHKAINRPVEISFQENKKLIGGYILEIDGYEADCSLATALNKIKMANQF